MIKVSAHQQCNTEIRCYKRFRSTATKLEACRDEHFVCVSVHTARDGFSRMRVQHDDVKLDFGQGQNDQRLYDAAAALRKQV